MSFPLVDAAAVAAHLGFKRRTIYEWAETGKIPARRIGNSYRFDLAEIDQWVEKRRVGPKIEEKA